eukprot:TRINITY_DN21935_c0_g1_i1.p1 TRINITY_DN21935_c0_g1~~TRINITY_DN21935_c0_g1_i1.p1  ORF type:complete len:221 (+),score=55.50 TRINITY_DN21935_c0_g1_i1:48-710(+)
MKKAVSLSCLSLLLSVATADPGKEFKDLEPLDEKDSWLALDTWNHIRVGEFVDFIARDFPECTLSGEVWKDHAITGGFLKTRLWEELDEKMLGTMKFEDNDDKLTVLGFPEDPEERKSSVARFRQRVDKEYLRRRDAKFRKSLKRKKSGKIAKAKKKLGLTDENPYPTEEELRKYKIKKLRYFFEAMDVDASKFGKEKHDLQKKALEVLAERTGKGKDEL